MGAIESVARGLGVSYVFDACGWGRFGVSLPTGTSWPPSGGSLVRSGAPRSRDSIPRLRAVFGGQPLWHPPIRVVVTWLILPVVICLSQRLSHACLSIGNYTVKLRMAH